ncbi:hypothetical protein APR04_002867 [Promicromonospora umidemergens]|uniref:Uncharacterized protein n=2 Tax=Promicromonospora umidemergens TaxID=629679 RepID=A0ABP8WML7_9MICO|nr:hypothetical protein [Promicromonospora umidemergens]
MWSPAPDRHRRDMTSPHLPAQPTPGRSAPVPVPWAVVGGLAALALLWPLAGLTGALGTGAPRALTIIGITAVVWIGVVGLGRVPRPVLTLTLTGVAYGLVAHAVALLVPVLGGLGGPGGGPLWTIVPALLLDAMWGALAGLAAAGVQRLRGSGR